jgi:nitrite reductase (NO-forming) / hydroxylamine reductase
MYRPLLSLLLSTAVSMTAVSAGAQQQKTDGATPPGKPAAADLQKHETKPGDRYEPSLDVLKEVPVEAPGSKPGVPQLTAEEFQHANQVYFDVALAATVCCVRGRLARR